MKGFWARYRTPLRIVSAAVFLRLMVYLFSAVLLILLEQYERPVSFAEFLGAWTRWDSPHYIDIARYGYDGCVESGRHLFLVFYPLFPWLLRLLHLAIADYGICGFLLNLITFAAGSLYFYKLAEKEAGEGAARDALLLLWVFPFSFFYGAILTESLFFALSAAFLWYLREHRWPVVAVLGFFACLTKVQGALLGVAVAAELLCRPGVTALVREKKWGEIAKKIILPGLLCSAMLAGLFVYLYINWLVEGDPFRFLYYQRTHWYNGFLPIWETVAYVAKNAVTRWYTSVGMSIWVPEFVLFFLWCAWIAGGFARRMRPALLAYLIALFLVTFSSSWLISGGRYTLCALPGFLLAGQWLQRHERWRIPLTAASVFLMAVYLTGYMTGKQVM